MPTPALWAIERHAVVDLLGQFPLVGEGLDLLAPAQIRHDVDPLLDELHGADDLVDPLTGQVLEAAGLQDRRGLGGDAVAERVDLGGLRVGAFGPFAAVPWPGPYAIDVNEGR